MEVSDELRSALGQLEIDAEQFRLRRSLVNEEQFKQTCARLGLHLPDVDIDGEVAELLVADVERIANNDRDALSVEVSRMPGDSRPFRIYLAACRTSSRERIRQLQERAVKHVREELGRMQLL